ncbi:MAG: hypothetical protein UT42_C0001G0023 [Candidatus Falkowbacteria bacterium GW2011_GWA2_39_24]|uniref:Restriction endonuclease type IV Mrr domain-containing protein n=1 Tax=Candidatus Falkowbacteria bacterium GW2011_GWA2_39_24 TaxID=1618634 RepID=A0A0G0NRP5_9BACT|nr:MAG: hypothetical protein UT42_C0001G0023 [Candidatus Falkowbacteria bacterium GW2011_GWA2_39_24]
MIKINPEKVFFIKLGQSGSWNQECIKKGIVKIGFNQIDTKDIKLNKWDKIHDYYSKEASNSVASLYTNQIKNFYRADGKTLWITFYNQKLWWCSTKGPIYENSDKTKYKKTVNGWSSKNISGKELLMSNLSGTLLAVQGFRSTICNVQDPSYIINKINAEESSEIIAVEKDFNQLTNSVGILIKKLRPKDFELLVDLIFRGMGCQRVGVVGGPQKTIDIELFSPVIGERYLVQVKSETNWKQYQEYQKRFSEHTGYDKYYYIYHTTKDKKLKDYIEDEPNIIIWGLDNISRYVINSGLISWLINKIG